MTTTTSDYLDDFNRTIIGDPVIKRDGKDPIKAFTPPYLYACFNPGTGYFSNER
jgi:hypothetical protein